MFSYKNFRAMDYKQSLRGIFYLVVVMILMMTLGSCNTVSSAGASASGGSVLTENVSNPQDTPVVSTQNSEDDKDGPLPGHSFYVNENYGFELTFPEAWVMEEEHRAVLLKHDSLVLRINFAWTGEEIGPGLFGRTGLSAGDFIYSGKVNFLGQTIPVQALEYEGKDKAFFYNGTDLIEVDDMVFMIVLEGLDEEYERLDISKAIQAEASLIVESLNRLDQVTECLNHGGRWEVLGFSGPGCNPPTSDGGEPCSDITGCEGLCLAGDDEIVMGNEFGEQVPDHERIEELNASDEPLAGICSEWQSNFGCQVMVEKGKYVVICID